MLSDSSTFLRFWLEDKCRDRFLSYVEKSDLASLRLTCHDFSVRAAPTLFNDLIITFRASTFTKPARLAALERLGYYVETLKFSLPHSPETFLPPLVDPESGAELSFTYTPLVEAPTAKHPKYGDIGTTEILTRQWPALFHAATNVPAFIRAFSSLINLSKLSVSCPGYDHTKQHRRNCVDFALISLRIAIERNNLNVLESLTLSPIHPKGLLYLSPLPGYGATPRSMRPWSRIKHLTVHADVSASSTSEERPDNFKLLQTYIRNFQSNLESFNFRWVGGKGNIPIQMPAIRREGGVQASTSVRKHAPPPLQFIKLKRVEFESVKASARDIRAFAKAHRRTIEDINLEDVELTGTWEEALAPLTRLDRPRPSVDTAEIPIMLSPTAFPIPMHRIEVAHKEGRGGKGMRLSRWLSSGSKVRTPAAARKVREGLLGCEEQLKKVFRGSILPWR